MSTQTMMSSHQRTPWEWALDQRSVRRLPAAAKPRWLVVTDGRVWLTRSGAGLEGGDIWLGAGEGHALPAGSEWVAEGWPAARVEVLEAPQLSA